MGAGLQQAAIAGIERHNRRTVRHDDGFLLVVVIDRQGEVVARFEPTEKMEDLEACVKKLI